MMAGGALSVKDQDVNTEQGPLKERVSLPFRKLSSTERISQTKAFEAYYWTFLSSLLYRRISNVGEKIISCKDVLAYDLPA